MISEKRLAAARANGAKSRGPVTAQGKANSARNSRRHGLRAQILFDHADLNNANFEDQRIALLTAYMDELQPNSEFERSLIEIMALSDMRAARLRHMETELLDDEIRRRQSARPAEPSAISLALAFRSLTDHSCALEILNRLESRFSRRSSRALGQFQAIRENAIINERTHQLSENKESRHEQHPKTKPPESPLNVPPISSVKTLWTAAPKK